MSILVFDINSVNYQIDKENKTIRRLEFIKAEGRHIPAHMQSHDQPHPLCTGGVYTKIYAKK